MYKKTFENSYFNFRIGEEISFGEIKWLALIAVSPFTQEGLTKEEYLLCKYCLAITNASNNLKNRDHQNINKMENTKEKIAIMETFMYMLNLEAMSKFDKERKKVTITSEGIFGHIIGNLYPEVIEFTLLQSGWKSNSDKILGVGYHSLVQCQPVSLRQLTDSIRKKLSTSEKELIKFDAEKKID